jgi:osomolarity two-component system sensor histidine kinase NIK1
MLGDREKCIQAQMDEYLSKPLKQSHLIQTILKCATLGGNLLEKGRDKRSSPHDETPKLLDVPLTPIVSGRSTVGSPTRPSFERHSVTTTGPIIHGSAESPMATPDEAQDALARAGSVMGSTSPRREKLTTEQLLRSHST